MASILIVDDQLYPRQTMRDVLREAGHAVLEAADPEEALALAERHAEPIDLLLTDVVMPHMSGHEMAGRLRASRPALRVIYMSGFPREAIEHHGVTHPDAVFLIKPISSATLVDTVSRVLASR